MTYLSCRGAFVIFHVHTRYAVSYLPLKIRRNRTLKILLGVAELYIVLKFQNNKCSRCILMDFRSSTLIETTWGTLKKINLFMIGIGHSTGYRKAEP